MFPKINGVFAFPPDDLPVAKKKTKEIGAQYALAIYQQMMMGSTLYGISDWTLFSNLRLYADGRQNIEELKDWYTGSENNLSNNGNSRLSAQGVDQFNPVSGSGDIVRGQRVFSPMDYQVVSPLPKVVDTVTGLILNEAQFKVQCLSLDPSHINQKNLMAWTAYYRATFARQQAEKLNVVLESEAFEPKTPEQVQIALNNNYFRLLFESGFEDIIKHVFDSSDFDRLALTWMRDVQAFGFICGKSYFCNESESTKVKYVDPDKFVVQWNNDTNGRGASYAGHVETLPMHIVKKQMAALGYPFKEIEQVARYAYGLDINKNIEWPSTIWEQKDNTGRWLWESLTIPVLEFEIITQNEKRYYKDENDKYTPIPEDNPNHKYDKKDLVTTVYEGTFILGTNYMMKWQEVPNNSGKLSYFWGRTYGQSLVQRCKSICDDIMKCVVKLRGELWAAAPSGYFFDLSAIGNIALNPADQKEFIQQAIAAHRQSGALFGQTSTKGGKTITDKPIVPMENGPANIDKYANQIAFFNNQILEVTGIPAVMAAMPTQKQDKAVGIGEIEVITAGHAMYPIKQALLTMKNFAAKLILEQVRLDIRFDPKQRKKWEGIIGKPKMDAIWEVRDLSIDDLAIELKAVPNIQQKQEMKYLIKESADASSRNGIVTLTAADMIFIYNLIDRDQVEIAQMYAAMVTEERMEKHRANAEASQAATFEGQAASAERAEAAKQKTIQMQIQLETVQKERLLMIDKQTPSVEVAQKLEGEKEQIAMEIAGQAATGKDIKNPRQ